MKVVKEHQSLLERIAADATIELFKAYDTPIRRDADTRPSEERILVCGIIGFTGTGIRGTCILATTDKPLAQSSPEGSSPRDWIAELTNQLTGRVKSRLLMHGAEIYLSTPVVMRGEHLAPLPRAHVLPLSFDAAQGGSVYVWIEIETAEGTDISQEARESDVALVEGESMLF